MQLLPRSTTVATRIYIIVACGVLATTLLLALSLVQLSDALIDQRRAELKHLSQIASAITVEEYDAFQSGRISESDAKTSAERRIAALRYGSNDYFWINDMHPRMVMHPIKPELNGQDLSAVSDPSGKRLFAAFVDTVRASGEGFVEYSWPKPGASEPAPKLSYVVGFEPWQWVIGTGVYIDDLHAQIWTRARTAIASALLVLLVLAGAGLAIARPLSQSIRKMTSAMRRLANGNADGELPKLKYQDEVAEMAATVAVFRSNLLERHRLEAEAKDAEARAKAEFWRLSDMLDEFKTNATDVIDATSSRMAELGRTSETLSAQASIAGRRSSSALTAAENSATAMQTVAAATEELSCSLRDVTERIHSTRRNVEGADQLTAKASAEVVDLTANSEKIGSIVSIISGIATRTNLLALNATIEASRAGEAGRGFAIVAQEVKTLSEQTAAAAKDITANIAEMQSVSNSSAAAIREISSAISEVLGMTSALADAIRQQEMAVNEIAQTAARVASDSSQLSVDIGSVSDVVAKTTTVAGDVHDASEELQRQGSNLANEIKRFILALRDGPLDRRRMRDPNYDGPERRASAKAVPLDKSA